MHLMTPGLNGMDMGASKDLLGKFLFKEMVWICREKGQGFLTYP